jgi:hypothetical protein
MGLIDRTFRLTNEPGGLGLSCSELGLSLAGVPLLHKTRSGFALRSPDEIEALVKAAYGAEAIAPELLRGFDTVARALNRGDLALAMTAAVMTRLPEIGMGRRALPKPTSGCARNTILTSRGIGMGAGQTMTAPTHLAKTSCLRILSMSALGQAKTL